jgi:hypothetical protein
MEFPFVVAAGRNHEGAAHMPRAWALKPQEKDGSGRSLSCSRLHNYCFRS